MIIGGKGKTPQTLGTPPGGTTPGATVEEKPAKQTLLLEPSSIGPYINEQLTRLSEKIAQDARSLNILPEAELERSYSKYLSAETPRQRATDWDYTHKLLDVATPQGEEGLPVRNEILRKLVEKAKSPMFQTCASIDLVVPGTYAELAEETLLWKHIIQSGAVILSFSKPCMFCIGTLTPTHMQLSAYLLTKIWEGTKEGNPKPLVSGFNLPYQNWKKLYLEQGARC